MLCNYQLSASLAVYYFGRLVMDLPEPKDMTGTDIVVRYSVKDLLSRIEVKLDAALVKFDHQMDEVEKRLSELERWRHNYEDRIERKDKSRDTTFLILGAVFTVLFILATVLVPILGG